MAGTGILLIRDLALVLVVAGASAWLCQRLGLSVVVGFLVAGAVIGPFTPPFALVEDLDRVQTLAQIGLVFLIFSIGLNLSLSRLKRLGLSTVVASILASLLVLGGCRVFGWAIGWTTTAGLFLAGMLMVSSSAIISKILDEENLTHERPGQLALAVTVFEDIVAITMLTILSSIGQFGSAKPSALLPTIATLAGFVLLLLALSLLLVPRLLTRLTLQAGPEIRSLIVAGILLALSWLAVQAGYSLALGAFIFGVIVGSTRHKADIERVFDGLRQLFGAVFFVAVGMMVDFRELMSAWPLVLAVTGLALFLRPIACSLGFLALGNPPRESIQAGLSLTPLGEFTFIMAQLGVQNGVLPNSMYSVAAGASLLTALAAPTLTRHSEAIALFAARAQPRLFQRWGVVYHEWLMRLRSHHTASILWRLTRKRLLQVGLTMLFISTLLLFVRPIYESARDGFQESFLEDTLPFLFWSIFGAALLAPLIALWRNVSALGMIIADAATTGSHRRALLRPVLERVLSFASLVALSFWLLAVLPRGWSIIGAAGAVLLLLGLVAALFWRRFVTLQSRIEIELLEQLHRSSQVTSASAWSDTLPQQTSDWELEIDEVTIPFDSSHVGKDLRQLALRRRFACSVIGIDRQGCGIVNPSADTVLYPQDKILLLGEREHLARAARELLQFNTAPDSTSDFDELTMETLKVPPGCTMAGKALLDLDLIGRFGVQIGGIRRGSRRNLSPRGSDRFDAGDELLLLGTHAQIAEFSLALAESAA